VNKVLKGRLGLKESREKLEILDHRVSKVHRASRVSRAFKVFKGRPV
jgi:hypothetical protein